MRFPTQARNKRLSFSSHSKDAAPLRSMSGTGICFPRRKPLRRDAQALEELAPDLIITQDLLSCVRRLA